MAIGLVFGLPVMVLFCSVDANNNNTTAMNILNRRKYSQIGLN